MKLFFFNDQEGNENIELSQEQITLSGGIECELDELDYWDGDDSHSE